MPLPLPSVPDSFTHTGLAWTLALISNSFKGSPWLLAATLTLANSSWWREEAPCWVMVERKQCLVITDSCSAVPKEHYLCVYGYFSQKFCNLKTTILFNQELSSKINFKSEGREAAVNCFGTCSLSSGHTQLSVNSALLSAIPSPFTPQFSTLCSVCRRQDLYKVHQSSHDSVTGAGFGIREPWSEIRGRKETEVRVFRSPTNFLQGHLWPAASFRKSHCFSQGGLLNTTLYVSH